MVAGALVLAGRCSLPELWPGLALVGLEFPGAGSLPRRAGSALSPVGRAVACQAVVVQAGAHHAREPRGGMQRGMRSCPRTSWARWRGRRGGGSGSCRGRPICGSGGRRCASRGAPQNLTYTDQLRLKAYRDQLDQQQRCTRERGRAQPGQGEFAGCGGTPPTAGVLTRARVGQPGQGCQNCQNLISLRSAPSPIHCQNWQNPVPALSSANRSHSRLLPASAPHSRGFWRFWHNRT
jgi:hypothetical protein